MCPPSRSPTIEACMSAVRPVLSRRLRAAPRIEQGTHHRDSPLRRRRNQRCLPCPLASLVDCSARRNVLLDFLQQAFGTCLVDVVIHSVSTGEQKPEEQTAHPSPPTRDVVSGKKGKNSDGTLPSAQVWEPPEQAPEDPKLVTFSGGAQAIPK